MAYNDLDVSTIELIKKRIAREDEIEKIYKVLTDVNLSRSLVSGRAFWVSLYNRKIAEYDAFCVKNTMRRMSVFTKITK